MLGNRGSSLLPVILMGAFVAGTAAFLMDLGKVATKQEAHRRGRSGIDLIKREVMAHLEHNGAWKVTLETNDSLKCVNPATPAAAPEKKCCIECDANNLHCTKSRSGNIEVFDASGRLPYPDFTNSPSPAGWDYHGKPCTSFDAVNGSSQCPFRLQMSWAAQCNSCNCPNPVPHFYGTITYKPQGQAPVFSDKTLKFTYIRGVGETPQDPAIQGIITCNQKRKFYAPGNPDAKRDPQGCAIELNSP